MFFHIFFVSANVVGVELNYCLLGDMFCVYVFSRIDVTKLKLFLFFMYTSPSNKTVCSQRFTEFNENQIVDVLDEVINSLYDNHTPYHVNLGEKHQITAEDLKEQHGTFWSKVFTDKYLDDEEWVAFSADGFYIETQSFGGHEGQKQMFSYKNWHISKVQNDGVQGVESIRFQT